MAAWAEKLNATKIGAANVNNDSFINLRGCVFLGDMDVFFLNKNFYIFSLANVSSPIFGRFSFSGKLNFALPKKSPNLSLMI